MKFQALTSCASSLKNTKRKLLKHFNPMHLSKCRFEIVLETAFVHFVLTFKLDMFEFCVVFYLFTYFCLRFQFILIYALLFHPGFYAMF